MRNAKELEQQLDDRERLLSVLDRAKMQEALNEAHEQLSLLPGADVPTYAEVERKILGRQAVAEAKGELNAAQFSAGVDPAMLEIEAAQRSAEAQALPGPDADPARVGVPRRRREHAAPDDRAVSSRRGAPVRRVRSSLRWTRARRARCLRGSTWRISW